MAKLSFTLRKTGETIEQMVCVRHFHQTKDTEFVRSTGVKVPPAYFDLSTGKVSNKLPISPEWNQTIQRVANDIETASRNLLGKGIHPTKAAMTGEYDRILAERATAVQLRPQADRILGKMLDMLKADLADLQEQVEAKKREIEREELRLGIHEGKLLTYFIEEYRKSKLETKAANTTRLYTSLRKVVTEYNPAWRIDEVTPETLAAFEKWLIGMGKKNLTITDTITKLKTVVYAFAKQLSIDTADIRAHKTELKKRRNPFVPYLTKEELQDLIDLPLTNAVEMKVRDRFVLMSLIGVRYSDSIITPDNVFNGNLLFTTTKTDTDLEIPMSGIVTELLARYDNNIPAYPSQYFNKVIKNVCAKVERLNYKIQVKTYAGANKATKSTKLKHEAISAHAARRTFINLALLAGVNPVAVAGIVGHEGTELIMKVYGSKEAGKERIAEIMNATA